MTDFTYPINTASKTAQRLFDIVRILPSAHSSLAGPQMEQAGLRPKGITVEYWHADTALHLNAFLIVLV